MAMAVLSGYVIHLRPKGRGFPRKLVSRSTDLSAGAATGKSLRREMMDLLPPQGLAAVLGVLGV